MTTLSPDPRPVASHAWTRAERDHYVEPAWCSIRLFEEEPFHGTIWDPACGTGRIVAAAAAVMFKTYGSDISGGFDFLEASHAKGDNIVTNPPFNLAEAFCRHAVELAPGKVATIFPTARLNAAHWIKELPLRRIWLLTPRPSMPPASYILAGKKAQAGKMAYCWLIFSKDSRGEPATIRWLHRDRV